MTNDEFNNNSFNIISTPITGIIKEYDGKSGTIIVRDSNDNEQLVFFTKDSIKDSQEVKAGDVVSFTINSHPFAGEINYIAINIKNSQQLKK